MVVQRRKSITNTAYTIAVRMKSGDFRIQVKLTAQSLENRTIGIHKITRRDETSYGNPDISVYDIATAVIIIDDRIEIEIVTDPIDFFRFLLREKFQGNTRILKDMANLKNLAEMCFRHEVVITNRSITRCQIRIFRIMIPFYTFPEISF